MHKRGGPDTPVALLCRVSCQQFCLQAKSHVFCVDFPGKLLDKLQLLFFVFLRPKTRKNCPKEDRQEGGWAPPLLRGPTWGKFCGFGVEKTQKITTRTPKKGTIRLLRIKRPTCQAFLR